MLTHLKIMVTQMFYDGFWDDMRDKFGYDYDEDAENHYQELLKKDQMEKENFSFDKCVFSSKSEAGLKIHGTKKHWRQENEIKRRTPSLWGPFALSGMYVPLQGQLQTMFSLLWVSTFSAFNVV